MRGVITKGFVQGATYSKSGPDPTFQKYLNDFHCLNTISKPTKQNLLTFQDLNLWPPTVKTGALTMRLQWMRFELVKTYYTNFQMCENQNSKFLFYTKQIKLVKIKVRNNHLSLDTTKNVIGAILDDNIRIGKIIPLNILLGWAPHPVQV